MPEKFGIFTRAVILNEKNEFLLVEKNSTQKIAPGVTVFPGGTVEYGEDVDQALIREVYEEVGLKVLELEFLCFQKIMSKGVHWLGVYYICKAENLDFKNMEPEKHSKVFWGEKKDIEGYEFEIYEEFVKKGKILRK